MNAKRTAGIFLSGFVVYGIVAACLGATPLAARRSSNTILARLADPVPRAAADSGSRLKAEFLLGEDGSKDYQIGMDRAPNGTAQYGKLYWDSERNEQCFFFLAGDGVSRCLPTDRVWYNYYPKLSYSDASCTQGLIVIPAGPPGCPQVLPKYAMSDELDPICSAIIPGEGRRHYYPVGAFLGPGPNTPCYGKDAANTCVPMACGAGAYHALGAEIDPTSFVGSTHMTDP